MKVTVKTFGCKVNQYESQLIRENLEAQGYSLSCTADADMVVVNTCCVTKKAEKEARSFIRKSATLGKRVMVTGCAARKQDSFINGFMPSVEAYRDADSLITSVCASRLHTISRFNGHTRAFVKIEDGCDNFCTYCIVPLVRGRVRSRPQEEILSEIGQLASAGFKEIVLTGIDLGAYGRDTGGNLISLFEKMKSIKGLRRIRLSSIEAFHMTDELAEYLLSSELFCRHLHIPLQSGSDRILGMMGRRYIFAEYLKMIENIRNMDRAGRVTFTTDAMVGFPGESEEDFRLTCEAIRRADYLRVHIFRYSRREGTAAFDMAGQVPETVKKRREKELERVVSEVCYNVKKSFEGKTLEVLVESKTENGWQGHSSEYVPVRFTGGQDLLNEIVTVTCREVKGDYVTGEGA